MDQDMKTHIILDLPNERCVIGNLLGEGADKTDDVEFDR
jgi:hypothetical protein